MANVGDFVNLVRWFGDVWAEVVSVGPSMTTFVVYSKYGNERWLDSAFAYEIRAVAKADDERLKCASVLYKTDFFYGSFPGRFKHWPTKLDANSKFSSAYRERFPK